MKHTQTMNGSLYDTNKVIYMHFNGIFIIVILLFAKRYLQVDIPVMKGSSLNYSTYDLSLAGHRSVSARVNSMAQCTCKRH